MDEAGSLLTSRWLLLLLRAQERAAALDAGASLECGSAARWCAPAPVLKPALKCPALERPAVLAGVARTVTIARLPVLAGGPQLLAGGPPYERWGVRGLLHAPGLLEEVALLHRSCSSCRRHWGACPQQHCSDVRFTAVFESTHIANLYPSDIA